MKIEALFLLGLLSVSNIAFAEGGCPPGTYPANPPATNICNPFPGNENNGQPQQPQGRWETRWGAIAADTVNGFFGASGNFTNKHQVQKAAIAKCKANGGKVCKLKFSYYNQCGVIAWGDAAFSPQSAENVKLASEWAMEKCGGLTNNCKIVYTDCSLPVWVE